MTTGQPQRVETDAAGLTMAAQALLAGELVIVPTDTVYGIAASVGRDAAVAAIYEAKGKGDRAPLQLLFGQEFGLLSRFAELPVLAARFIDSVGPGGWTAIVPAKPGWSSPALAGGTTVGIRIPDVAAIHELVGLVGLPLAASSANRHGAASPRTVEEAIAGVGDSCSVAIDGGEVGGLDSTVIDLAGETPRILREGAIARETVLRILGLDSIEVLRSVRP